jgi:uncharacterized protein YdhG (YjbR/CyaY superfamily)
MPADEIDSYLASLDQPGRSTLERLRSTIREIVPDAEEGLSYGAPAFRVDGTTVAGFAASKNHLSYLPHSGSVLATLDPALLEGYEWSKGALRFAVAAPLPKSLVEALITARRAEIAG